MKYPLPKNCEIEMIGADLRDRTFRLHFYAENGSDYFSEDYAPRKGERTRAAAFRICEKFGWDKNPPATDYLTS